MPFTSNNIIQQHGRIAVHSNGHFFVHEDGTPFFWLGDTAWELFHRLSKEDAAYYLQTRSSQGFNVVQAVVLAELDGLLTPNAEGEIPFVSLNTLKPNEKYFAHVDWVIKQAEKSGIYIALLPTWGDKVKKRYDWAKGPEIFNEQNIFGYAQWLAKRYASQKNIIWVVGGDRNPEQKDIPIWRSMAAGIKSIIGQALITFHPQPFDGCSSSTWFHKDDWLGFNMLQTGHHKYTPVYETIQRDYHLAPAKPVINGEPTYEAHGLSFKPFELGYSSDAEVRKYAYWSVFAGACGHTYGCHSVWQFYEKKLEPVNFPLYEWKEALQLTGARQMQYLLQLMQRNNMLQLKQGDDLIVNRDAGDIENYIIAIKAVNGAFAYVYSTTGKAFSVFANGFNGNVMICTWLNPKDGSATIPQQMQKQNEMAFIPPNNGYGNDWVLIIECLP